MYKKLADCPLFTGLRADEIEELFNSIQSFTKTFSQGQMIAQAGEDCKYLICVLEGSVKGEMVDYSGKTIKIEDIGSPRALAIAFLFGKNSHYPVNIISNEETKLLFIPKSETLLLMQTSQAFLRNFLNAVSSRTQFLSNKIKFLSFKTIKGKLAQYFLQIAGDDSDEIELPVSQTALADMFGVARPSVARALKEMSDEKIIRIERRKIRILDRKALIENNL